MAFYEWWCPRCRVTHPPGRKVCVHCGGRVQPSRDAAQTFDPRAALERLGLPAPEGEAPEPAETDDEPVGRAGRAARAGMTLVWIAVAVLLSLARLCQERG